MSLTLLVKLKNYKFNFNSLHKLLLNHIVILIKMFSNANYLYIKCENNQSLK